MYTKWECWYKERESLLVYMIHTAVMDPRQNAPQITCVIKAKINREKEKPSLGNGWGSLTKCG